MAAHNDAERTHAEVGKRLGMSPRNVQDAEQSAFRKIRRAMGPFAAEFFDCAFESPPEPQKRKRTPRWDRPTPMLPPPPPDPLDEVREARWRYLGVKPGEPCPICRAGIIEADELGLPVCVAKARGC